VLDVQDVTLSFGGLRALDRVSIHAEEGRITGIIGPNGAGKTTLFNVICGLVAPEGGRVSLAGEDLRRLGPAKRARRGLGRTFQRLELFTMLSVRENVQVAVETHRTWAHRRGDPRQRAQELLEHVGLEHVADERATRLTTGQGRLVELARALACEPKALLLDEPASGQDEHETERFAAILRHLAERGVAVVMVEHDMRLVMGVCDHIQVLDAGRLLAAGRPEDIRRDETVLSAYLGSGAVG
jgi:branched-chain amino acid transport system ATP-binding protein